MVDIVVPSDGSSVEIPGIGTIKIAKTESKIKAWAVKVWNLIKSSPAVFLYGAGVGYVAHSLVSLFF